MHYIYCPFCGTKLTEIQCGDDGMVPYCKPCDKRWFDSFESCVIVLTYNEYDEVVLCRQGYLSDKYTSVTAGFITPGETAEECAIREVKEEIGLDLETLEYVGTYWFAKREQLMHGFIGFSPKKELTLSGEIDSAEWVPALEAPKTMFPAMPGSALHAIYHRFLEERGLETQDRKHKKTICPEPSSGRRSSSSIPIWWIRRGSKSPSGKDWTM